MAFNVGDIVTYGNYDKTGYKVLAVDSHGIPIRVQSTANKNIYEEAWEIKHFKLVPPDKTSQEKLFEKIKFLEKKAEATKLATSSKQVDAPSVVAVGETGQGTTSQSTAMDTPSALHVDMAGLEMLRAELIRQGRYYQSPTTGFTRTPSWIDEHSNGLSFTG